MSNLMISVSTKMPYQKVYQGNSTEVSEKPGKMKVEKETTLDAGVGQFSFVVLSEINYNNEKVI